eukprot:CAMPEP_0177538352 /NCGR_PEP_ID=MMETSP0369-20130122/58333_1 /TAXON_ID=447022 ORGANISM="Scrippsiella hangoei-like, Strain SHHI-4" /NCGR_SAMPLE_ID=MMETSP0369 /ASSEMBLY_ACC=CAM_ASM_000364 /LENGTH=137 /DNA_ID=CAMNT_0019021161 /DNA_START=15 /DNA_END=424 /DNA_ORIENTATION=+
MAPSSLIWECVKNNSSFIRKSTNMRVMSSEAGNLCGLNSYKFSGLASSNVLDISGKNSGAKESIMMTTSHKKASRHARPGSILLSTGVKKSSKKGLAQISKALEGGFYRRDLMEVARAKYVKVKTSFKKKKVVFKSR